MWGSDYPHDEGTPPYTREHLRQVFPASASTSCAAFSAVNAAKLYGFDLDALAPLAATIRPDGDRAAAAPHHAPGSPQRGAPAGRQLIPEPGTPRGPSSVRPERLPCDREAVTRMG